MKNIFLILLTITIISCTDESNAKKVLEKSGYSNITFTGYRWFGSKEDIYRTGFTATAPNGQYCTGCVSKGAFKGYTIKLDD